MLKSRLADFLFEIPLTIAWRTDDVDAAFSFTAQDTVGVFILLLL